MPTIQNSKSLIKEILLKGTKEEKQKLFSFSLNDEDSKILFKFKLFAQTNYSRYFTHESAPFHDEMVLNFIKSYRSLDNVIEIAFRGASKTSIKKLFDTFVILNDTENTKKYIKILSKDLKNSKQIVTDVYNLMVEVRDIYGDIFEDKSDIKREETMGSFTTVKGVKYSAGTIGQTQRGHIQDAYRPDWLWFDDVEDRETVSSLVQTESIISKADEAIQGLSFTGSYVVTANYISDAGVVQWYINKGILVHIVPIIKNDVPTWSRYTSEKIEQLKKDAEDWNGEYLCLKPDTKIKTPNGYKKISDIQVGDLVISHLGKEQRVLKTFKSEAKDLLDITVNGKTVTITKNHPVLIIRENKEEWIKAGELTEEDLVVVTPRGKLYV